MSEVKRWNRGGRLFRGAMVEVGDGDWVEYSDYATLKARSEALEKERDALTQKLKASEAEVAQIGSYCQTLTDAKVELAAELGEAQAEVAKLRDDAALHDETLEICNKQFASLRAEVERLSAACAAKDAAIRELDNRSNTGDSWSPVAEAALSDTAGKGWIDASGAVEAEASRHVVLGNTWLKDGGVLLPGDWAGSKVKIVQVKP